MNCTSYPLLRWSILCLGRYNGCRELNGWLTSPLHNILVALVSNGLLEIPIFFTAKEKEKFYVLKTRIVKVASDVIAKSYPTHRNVVVWTKLRLLSDAPILVVMLSLVLLIFS